MRLPRFLLVSVFLAGLFAPGLEMVLRVLPRDDTTEKRALAPLPSLSSTPAIELPGKLGDYVRDHFGFRDVLIRLANRFRVTALHTSPVRNAIIGRDGWLFYGGYEDGADIRDFLGHLPLSPAELEARKRAIVERRAALAAHGITYLFVVAPNKQTIYPDKVPLWRGSHPTTRLDQVAWNLGRDPRIPVLDLRATLAAARSQREVYYRTDSHWNWHGSFLAFQAILGRLAAMRPGVPAVRDGDVRFVDHPVRGGDVASLLSMSDDLTDVDQDWEWLGAAPRSPLRVVLLGDSFADYLQPYFEARFSYVNSYEEAHTPAWNLDAILAQQPDIVIENHAERYLTSW